ncbi:hypothetical protein H310_08404 [Aphanomyces invadans]|uniref:Ubiquitin-like domain-containing protein n=1 Tax=Aphanomyces invadans TaxID=157072 RepID=A0A024TXQ4_9STRA|nr:hypothetical protein H310_08404 [Aphanomyces invadans]ETV98915.1 hypothetical protein H310_08404 [Aphanomyces invadans]|eukprot:XP_008872343.1 hypothetical protein H310_08404 [Aphanomyces invadans]
MLNKKTPSLLNTNRLRQSAGYRQDQMLKRMLFLLLPSPGQATSRLVIGSTTLTSRQQLRTQFKPVDLPKSKTIKVVVKCDEDDMAFKVKRTAYLQKIFDNFAHAKGIPVETLRFFFDGTRLKGDVTVESLGLESDCRIDCFSEQVGGAITAQCF